MDAWGVPGSIPGDQFDDTDVLTVGETKSLRESNRKSRKLVTVNSLDDELKSELRNINKKLDSVMEELAALCPQPGRKTERKTTRTNTRKWKEMNDPVMGGKSIGTFTIDKESKVGVFNGTCAIVPSLKAPGFITAVATGSTPDISHCQNLVLNVNSGNNYAGFRVSFGNEHYPPIYQHFFARGFKSDFQPPQGKFGDVELPLKGFTDHWDDATGKAITKCSDDPKACPTQKRLQNLETISIWGEGVEGNVHLEIKSIRASGCSSKVVV